MPVIHRNRPIFRIKFKDADIREVRKGNELQWGLYLITYTNKGPKDVIVGWEEGDNIPNYVWGYPNQKKEDFKLVNPEDATAAESKEALGDGYGYRSHAVGWYSNYDCDDLYFIPVVERDFHKDMELFCKWKQRRYLYNGVGEYDKEVDIFVGYEWVDY